MSTPRRMQLVTDPDEGEPTATLVTFPDPPVPKELTRVRMTGAQRRVQLLQIGRTLFAERGLDGTSVEEIATVAGVSKPVVYEHFGGKEGLYAVVVDHEVSELLRRITQALDLGPSTSSRELLEHAAFGLFSYIEECAEGFRILIRDSPVASTGGTFATLINDAASQVEGIMTEKFLTKGFNAEVAPMYAQMLVGMVALTGQWWLDTRQPPKDVVVAHLVNLAWNGLRGLESAPGVVRDAGRSG